MQPNLYFIGLIPPDDICGRVKTLKEEMSQRFGARHALKSPAHITLQMPFRKADQCEGKIKEVLDTFVASQSPFSVELSGFGCFTPRVIFIGVGNNLSLMALQHNLKKTLHEDLHLGTEEFAKNFHPHMTIATRDLRESAFYRAWPEFEERPFTDTFYAERLFLLKHNGKYWDVHSEYVFKQ
jgi:2'-5' RNA ligase